MSDKAIPMHGHKKARPGESVKALAAKLLSYLVSAPASLSLGEKLRSAAAAFVAVLAVGWISGQFVHGTGLTVLVASMGASAILLFAVPHSPLTQPWPLVGGHLISAFVGVSCVKLIPDPWVAAAAAVSLSIFLMHLCHSLHPPGGAVALVAVLGGDAVHAEGYRFVLEPVGLNVALMLVLALVINNLLPGHRYPARQESKKDRQHRHEDPVPLSRVGLSREDLRTALRELDTYLDISEADLDRVYARAGLYAFQRRMGSITCADIMSRDLVTAEYATPLEEVWARLRYHKIKAIPVVDDSRRVIGIVTLVDFLKRARLKRYESFEDKLIQFVRRGPGKASEGAKVVGEIMTMPVLTARDDLHISELVPLLSDRGLHHVPIVDVDGRLVGMVTQSDLIAALYAGDVRR